VYLRVTRPDRPAVQVLNLVLNNANEETIYYLNKIKKKEVSRQSKEQNNMDMKCTQLFRKVLYKCKAITTKGRNYSKRGNL
jgi:hypothetical protein